MLAFKLIGSQRLVKPRETTHLKRASGPGNNSCFLSLLLLAGHSCYIYFAMAENISGGGGFSELKGGVQSTLRTS